uniref:Uncharacterized protein n=1 Tax=Amphimedon queenslandica TaxID=400682 RepID=A0A1X7UDH5_AMPQE
MLQAVFAVMLASSAISVTGYSRDHQKIAIFHCCKVNLDPEKKLLSLMDLAVLQVRQDQDTKWEPARALFLSVIVTGGVRNDLDTEGEGVSEEVLGIEVEGEPDGLQGVMSSLVPSILSAT